MRKLIVNTFVTLDGVMQAPGGPEEDPTGGFDHGGWSVNYWDDVMMRTMSETMGKPFDLVLGRRTYEIFAAHWPYSDEPGAEQLNNATKYVASRTLTSLEWQKSQLIPGDVADGVAALKQGDGPELQVHGSSGLNQTLLRYDLVDEFRIMVFPLVLGKGKRLFDEGTPPRGLEVVDHKTSTTGVMITTYRPAGEVEVGTFARDEPSEAEIERRRKFEGEG